MSLAELTLIPNGVDILLKRDTTDKTEKGTFVPSFIKYTE